MNRISQRLKKLFCLIGVVFFLSLSSLTVHSQRTPSPAELTEIWTLLKSQNDVELSYYLSNTCYTSKPAIFLKIENKSAVEVTISWVLWQNEISKSTIIKPKQIKKAECASVDVDGLVVFYPEGHAENTMVPQISITPTK